jgi:hypothetical protein
MRRAAFLTVTILALAIPLAMRSQSQDDDLLDIKSYGCSQHLDLVDLEDGRSDIVTVWAHGYYNGMRGVDEKSEAGIWINVEDFSAQLLKICQQDSGMLFISAVRETARALPGNPRP